MNFIEGSVAAFSIASNAFSNGVDSGTGLNEREEILAKGSVLPLSDMGWERSILRMAELGTAVIESDVPNDTMDTADTSIPITSNMQTKRVTDVPIIVANSILKKDFIYQSIIYSFNVAQS